MRSAVLVLAAMVCTACATASGEGGATPDSLAAALVGEWDNARQIAAAPAAFVGRKPAGEAWIDAQRLSIVAAGAGAVRVDWGDGRAERWRFINDGAAMRLEIEPGPGAGPGCALIVRPSGPGSFDAAGDPLACQADADLVADHGLALRITLMPTGLLHQMELWRTPEELAFKIPGATPYEFRRR